MLFKKQGFPEEGELVLCTVTSVQFHSVFVDIDEYGKGGMIHISEVSPGRIRNIRDFVREGKVIVCKVLKIHPDRGHIDLSLRRVSQAQRINKNKDAKLSRYAGNLTLTSKEGYLSTLAIEVILTDLEDTSIIPTSPELEGFETEVVEEEANETIPTEEITPRRSALPTILIIVFILVVALVSFLIIRKKRKKKPTRVEVTYPKPTESERFKEHLRKLEELKK